MDRKYHTIVIGSGAAGFNAADRLYEYGCRDIAVLTEDVNAGTSRNTGSDKQTYYKLSLSGDTPDSVRALAETLYGGKCMDGDHALIEAAHSAQCFFKLAELGVKFPFDEYGQYAGYKTDHDPARRAASAGPYTSRSMTERLEKSVREKGVPVIDRMRAIEIIVRNGKAAGILCLDLSAGCAAYAVFRCKNIIFATGGPAGIYADSVYPESHYGATGIALTAGARGKNLTEWQYGLASVRPRWNVSGTYMQALPKVVSTDRDGKDGREFLPDYFKDRYEMLSALFLKGYQWPFDVRKISGGSSVIDLLVYKERNVSGRRVFLDFRENSGGDAIDFSRLSKEAGEYLGKAGAGFGTPAERLWHMNAPAAEFYLENGVDLRAQPLEIALCAQHNNGGLAVDEWWQTCVGGLYAAGEAAGTHGVYRPGGSALNSGQAGSMRAALAIKLRGGSGADLENAEAEALIESEIMKAKNYIGTEGNAALLYRKAAERMSRCGGPIRRLNEMEEAAAEIGRELAGFDDTVRVSDAGELYMVYRLRETLVCQYAYLSAMIDYVDRGGKSRGSALYLNTSGCGFDVENLEYELEPDVSQGMSEVQEVVYSKSGCAFEWRKARPIPETDGFFENVWRGYRERMGV